MNITGYLAGARQRFTEFGGFWQVEPSGVPAAIARWADVLLVRDEPGQFNLVALTTATDDPELTAMRDELKAMVEGLDRPAETVVIALVIIVAETPTTQERYDRWQALAWNEGGRSVAFWIMDLSRGFLFEHSGGPLDIDPDLRMLTVPDSDDDEEHGPLGALPSTRPPGPAASRGPITSARPGWQVPEYWATFGLLVAIAAVFIAMTLKGGSLGATQDTAMLEAWGAVVRPDLWVTRQYWRLLSAAFLHIGPAHLFMNGYSLWVVGRVVETLYGPVRMLYIYFIAAVAGSVLSSILGPAVVVSAGASGAIFGLLGAVVWYRLSSPVGYRIAWRPLLLTLAINLAMGVALYRMIDNWNHVGGLLGGLLASFAVGTPAIAGMAPPRFRLGTLTRAAVVTVIALAVLVTLAGKVDLPGPGRDLAGAYAAFDVGDYAGAEAGFLTAVKRQPDQPGPHYGLTLIYLSQKRCPEAQSEAAKLAALVDPTPQMRRVQEAVQACK